MSSGPHSRSDSALSPQTPDGPQIGRGIRRPSLPLAFKYRPYRLYWSGAVASVAGYNLIYFAQLWLVYQITPSPLYLGLVGAANAIPAFLLTMVGGAYADRADRRKVILMSQVALAVMAAVMAVLAITDTVQLWHIFSLAAFAGAVSAFDLPARQAFYPGLVERRALPSAVALNASVWQGARVAAPAAAGFMIALAGTSIVFVAGAVGFAMMASLLLRVRPLRPAERDEPVPETTDPDPPGTEGSSKGTVGQMAEGLGYVRKRPEFKLLIGMVMFSSFFGGGYIMLMPVFAVDILDIGAQGQGVLLAMSGVGSLAVTLWMSTRGRLKGTGNMIVIGAALSGLSIAAFGLTARYVGSYALAGGLMFTTGVFTSMYMISIMTALQTMVPDRLRGRVMALYGISWSAMLMGGLQAGLIANYVGAPVAVTVGGILVTGFALGPALASRGIRHLGEGGGDGGEGQAQSLTIGQGAAGTSVN